MFLALAWVSPPIYHIHVIFLPATLDLDSPRECELVRAPISYSSPHPTHTHQPFKSLPLPGLSVQRPEAKEAPPFIISVRVRSALNLTGCLMKSLTNLRPGNASLRRCLNYLLFLQALSFNLIIISFSHDCGGCIR